MRITGLLAVIVVLSSQPAVAVKRHASIPEPLQGSWALNADAYKNEDKSAFVPSARAFTGSEGSCSVLWVSETASVRGPTYSARLQCTNQRSQKRSESKRVRRRETRCEVRGLVSSHRRGHRRPPPLAARALRRHSLYDGIGTTSPLPARLGFFGDRDSYLRGHGQETADKARPVHGPGTGFVVSRAEEV
jgi:hypothetical protein